MDCVVQCVDCDATIRYCLRDFLHHKHTVSLYGMALVYSHLADGIVATVNSAQHILLLVEVLCKVEHTLAHQNHRGYGDQGVSVPDKVLFADVDL